MIQNADIIYFTLFRWNNPYSSVSLSFCKEFAKNNRVFYVNHPISYKDLLSGWNSDVEVKDVKSDLLKQGRIIEQMELDMEDVNFDNIINVTPPLSFPINWLSEGNLYDFFWKRNERAIKKTIKEVIEKYDIKDYIFLNCFDPFFIDIIPEEYPPLLNIYQCIDDIKEEPYTAKHGPRLEGEAARQADIVTVTSTELKNLMSRFSDNVHIVHNAADISLFNNAMEVNYDRPAEIAHVTNKIIGFTGNLDGVRIDYKLIKQVAVEHPDKTVLLIGPLNTTDHIDEGLDQMDNVIFTGSKDITELPMYLQYCDCVMIPFLLNKLTRSIYPLKINEYLASGRAVVSTDFSKDIRTFGEHIYIADNYDHFSQLVNRAIEEDSPERVQARLDVAATNTWTARVKEFWNIVTNHSSKQSKKTRQVV